MFFKRRTKKSKKEHEETVEQADLTPMIDVTFLLLIFFVLNLKFAVAESELQAFLPKDKGPGTAAHKVDVDELRIKLLWVTADGRPTTGDDGQVLLKIGRNVYHAPGELNTEGSEAIWQKLCDDVQSYDRSFKRSRGLALDGKKGIPAIIDARRRVPYRYVVRVVNELVRMNIEEVTFAAPERPY